MARFNSTKKKSSTAPNTTNLAGGAAYTLSAKQEVASILITSMLKDQYYRSANDTTARLLSLLPSVGYEFAAKASIVARNDFGLRSVTHVIGGEVAGNVKGAKWTRSYYRKLFHRPDDMLEVMSYYASKYAKNGIHPIPNALRRAIADTMRKYSAYQLEKYRGNGKAIKMVDLARLCGVQATPAIKTLRSGGEFDKNDTQRWETMISDAGRVDTSEDENAVATAKADAWGTLLAGKKLGYLALLRNCSNIIAQAPEMIPMLCDQLRDKASIERNKIFPFQIMTAIDQITNRSVKTALIDAVELSLSNVPKFDGKTLVVVDVSGSMAGDPIKNASLFAAALYKTNDADLICFGSHAAYVQLNARDSLATLAKNIAGQNCGGSTNFPSIFGQMGREKYDRIVILSDMQGYVKNVGFVGYREYCRNAGVTPHLYSFDLNGYGSLQFPESRTYLLGGFSSAIFNVMEKLEEDREALITKIENVVL